MPSLSAIDLLGAPSLWDYAGGHPDGNNHNTNAFLRAIASCKAKGYGKLIVPGGARNYRVDSPLDLPSSFELAGHGPTPTIEYIGVADYVLRNDDQTNGNSKITIRNLAIDGGTADDPTNGGCIDMRLVTDLIVENVRAIGSNGSGVWARQCTRVLIVGCYCEDNGGLGSAIDLNCTHYGRVINNIVVGSASDGIGIYGVAGRRDNKMCIVEGNHVITPTGHGILIGLTSDALNVTDWIVKNNIIETATLVGIVITGGALRGRVEGNRITGALGNAGIRVLKNQHAVAPTDIIIAKNIVDSCVRGIDFRGELGALTNFTVEGNHVSNCDYAGILVNTATNTVSRITIRGNHCWNNSTEDSTQDGITLIAGGSGTIEDCIIEANQCWDDQQTPTQRYGIALEQNGGTVRNCDIVNNNASGGNIAGALLAEGTGHNVDGIRGHDNTSKRAYGILRVAAAVEDGETVTIGADVYEFDTHDAETITPGDIRVDLSGSSAVKSQGTLTVDTQPVGLTRAQGTLTIDTQPTAGDQMTIGAKTYTFTDDLTANEDGEIDVGADLAGAQANIVAAINGTDGINSPHPTVTAAAFANDACVITAITGGAASDLIATTENFTAGTNVFDDTTLGATTAGTDGDTMTIGAKEFTFVEAGQADADGEISVGADLAAAKVNIVAAINGTDGVNAAHTLVSAAAFAGNDCVITALAGGTAGDSIATTETFTAGTNIFDAGTLGTTAAGVDCPADEATIALNATIGTQATEAVSSRRIDANTLLITSDVVGVVALATETDMGGGGNAWDAATLGGGAAANPPRIASGARVPTAAEATAGSVFIPVDFLPVAVDVQVRVTATGAVKAWGGLVTITAASGGASPIVTLTNNGTNNFDANDTIHYVITN